jgi:O-antigen/teichoic acid export membrane protein
VANIVGRGTSVLFALAFVPLYLRLLGTEGYGLVGFFLMLQAVLLLADSGFSGAVTREIARLSSKRGDQRRILDICRTFEVLFLAIGLSVAALVAATSGFIAHHWVNAESLSVGQVRDAILFMGVAIGLQLSFSMYQGALIGLQRHVMLNMILVAAGLMRGVGAVALLVLYDPSPSTFFSWQALVNIAQLLVGHIAVWRQMPKSDSVPHFDLAEIKPLWSFAVGLGAIGVTSTILTQVDKLVLSKMLPLSEFGYYSLAAVVAGVPMLVAGPFQTAVYPRFASLVASGAVPELTKLYHVSCQFLAVLMLPIGWVVVFFSRELIFLWTGDVNVASGAYLIASWLAVGSSLLGLMHIPYALQLAFGWTALPLTVNLIAITLLVPLTVGLAWTYGAVGVAAVWVLLNLGYVTGSIQWMHRRLLSREKAAWYIDDVIKPFSATLGTFLVGRALLTSQMSAAETIVLIGGTTSAAIVLGGLSAPLVRSVVLSRLIEICKPAGKFIEERRKDLG